jgi:hypothetical protein
MTNGRLTPNGLIIIALTAVFSLAAAHLTDLGTRMLGSGAASTPALIGDVLGLLACAPRPGSDSVAFPGPLPADRRRASDRRRRPDT